MSFWDWIKSNSKKAAGFIPEPVSRLAMSATEMWKLGLYGDKKAQREDTDGEIQEQIERISNLLRDYHRDSTTPKEQFSVEVNHQLRCISKILEEKTRVATQAAPSRVSVEGTPPPRRRKSSISSPSRDGLSFADMDELRKLFSRCRHGKVEAVKEMLESGIPCDVRDEYGNTVMMIAAQNGHKRIVRLCLSLGAKINAKNVMTAHSIAHSAV